VRYYWFIHRYTYTYIYIYIAYSNICLQYIISCVYTKKEPTQSPHASSFVWQAPTAWRVPAWKSRSLASRWKRATRAATRTCGLASASVADTASACLTLELLIWRSWKLKKLGQRTQKQEGTWHTAHFLKKLVVWAAVLCTNSTQDLYWDIVRTDGIRGHNSPQHAASATSTFF